MTAFDNDRWEAERKARLERVGKSEVKMIDVSTHFREAFDGNDPLLDDFVMAYIVGEGSEVALVVEGEGWVNKIDLGSMFIVNADYFRDFIR
jgi:hypothetical protein